MSLNTPLRLWSSGMKGRCTGLCWATMTPGRGSWCWRMQSWGKCCSKWKKTWCSFWVQGKEVRKRIDVKLVAFRWDNYFYSLLPFLKLFNLRNAWFINYFIKYLTLKLWQYIYKYCICINIHQYITVCFSADNHPHYCYVVWLEKLVWHECW